MSLMRDLVRPRTSGPWIFPRRRKPREPLLESFRYERGGRAHRAHLRVDHDGSGVLILDARRIVRLGSDGVALAREMLRPTPASGRRRAAADSDARHQLEGVLAFEDPGASRGAEVNLAEAGVGIGHALPEIPYVATLEASAATADVLVDRVRKAAALGLPHLVFRPLEGCPSAQLVAAVRAAEDLGLVTGVAAAGDLACDDDEIADLAQAGLDHLGLVLAGADAAAHDAVLGGGDHARLVRACRRAASLDVPLTMEVPLVSANWPHFAAIAEAAGRMGARGLAAFALVSDQVPPVIGAIEPSHLRQVAVTVEAAADRSSLPMTWAAPVRTTDVARDARRGPRTEGDFGARVLVDGTILAPRGPVDPAGNLDDVDRWSAVSGSDAWLAFSARVRGRTRCGECPGLLLCATDCPTAPEGWS